MRDMTNRRVISVALLLAGLPPATDARGTHAERREVAASGNGTAVHAVRYAPPHRKLGARGIETSALSAVVQRYCVNCHSPRQLRGNLNLEGYNVDSASGRLDVSEKMIRKLRAQM